MKRQSELVRTCVIGAALVGAGLLSTGAEAQTAKATDAFAQGTDAIDMWWFHGTVEAGGRVFLNNPPRNGSVYLGQNSLAKYYEYSKIAPGPFSNIRLSAGSKDGLYQIDFGGKNIGYGDQNYYLDLSKAGEHYLSLGWDQSPHLYSTSAQTIFNGVGTTTLSSPCSSSTATLPAGTPTSLQNCLHTFDLGIKRDTASFQYRWTPADAWDIKADYAHMHRTGTQADGVVGISNGSSGGSGAGSFQVPKPVDDTTQNYALNGEYAGTSLWNQRFTVKLGYSGSQYTDDASSYTVLSPLCNLGTTTCGSANTSPVARLASWPSNQANGFSGTLGADLPWKSRYVGMVSYAMMRQNDTFQPMTAYPLATYTLPASSLNGAINTVLVNNVVTTKITPELTNKLTYRYYDFQNNTPEIAFANWIKLDQNSGGAVEPKQSSLSISYTKQNAGEELNWRPTKEWNFGAGYGFEHYDWTRADVDATNEHSGKIYGDWKPASWFTLRTSGYYSNRRYDTYNNQLFVGSIQNPTQPTTSNLLVNPAYRQLMFDNRQRYKANVALDVLVLPDVTVTPTFKYQDDNYGIDPRNQSGLENARSWNGGVDVTYVVNRDAAFTVGYLREYYTLLAYYGTGVAPTGITNDKTVVDTFTALGRYAAIPGKLDLTLRLTMSHATDHLQYLLVSGATPTGGQFPDYTTWFERVDATAEYRFDKDVLAQTGMKGILKAKLHYVWESNSVANWQNDPLAPFTSAISSNSMYLASDNPNYNVHLLMASIAYSW